MTVGKRVWILVHQFVQFKWTPTWTFGDIPDSNKWWRTLWLTQCSIILMVDIHCKHPCTNRNILLTKHPKTRIHTKWKNIITYKTSEKGMDEASLVTLLHLMLSNELSKRKYMLQYMYIGLSFPNITHFSLLTSTISIKTIPQPPQSQQRRRGKIKCLISIHDISVILDVLREQGWPWPNSSKQEFKQLSNI